MAKQAPERIWRQTLLAILSRPLVMVATYAKGDASLIASVTNGRGVQIAPVITSWAA